MLNLSAAIFDKISYWEEIESIDGQIQFYLQGIEYFKVYDYVQRRKYIKGYFNEYYLKTFYDQVSKIEGSIEKYDHLTQNDEYSRLKEHFSICGITNCKECGGNILNIMMLKIEPIRKNVINELSIRNILEDLKKFPNNTDSDTIKDYTEKIRELNELGSFEEYCNSKNFDWEKRSQKSQINNYIPAIIEHSLRSLIYHNIKRIDSARLSLFYLPSKNKKNRRLLIRTLKNYRKSSIMLDKIIKPLTFLSPIGRRLNEPFIYEQKVFHEFDREIKKIGREGEKIIFEGLKETYLNEENIEVKWVNKNVKGTGTEHPYDILIIKPTGTEYIEIKTSHSHGKAFTMSQNELEFAKNNRLNYYIYLITNLGKGFDTELEVFISIYSVPVGFIIKIS